MFFAVFFLGSSILAQPQGRRSSKPKRPPTSITAVGLGGEAAVNDGFKAYDLFRRPYVFYSKLPSKDRPWQLLVITAAIYNQLRAEKLLTDRFSFFGLAQTLFFFDGDRPRVDGQDLDAFKFKAHRLSFSGGGAYRFEDVIIPFKLSLDYRMDYRAIFDKAGGTTFTNPEDFFTQSLGLIFSREHRGPRFEIFYRNIQFKTEVRAAYRLGNKAWGVQNFQRKVDRFVEVNNSIRWSYAFNPVMYMIFQSDAAWRSDVDRLNAAGSMGYFSDANSIMLRDIKSDRLLSTDAGFRLHLMGPYKYAIRVFGHYATYRELTPQQFRKDSVGGPGVKLMALFTDKFFGDVTYVAGFGHRSDLSVLHGLSLNFLYTF